MAVMGVGSCAKANRVQLLSDRGLLCIVLCFYRCKVV